MGKAQREKGKRGERELAGILRDYGYNCRRGQQYCGTSGDADVIGLPDVHIEVKRVEDLRLRKALQQASRDARAGEIPVVMHRRNREPWQVSMYLQNFQKMYSDDIFDELRARIRGGIITLLLDAWVCYYRDWQPPLFDLTYRFHKCALTLIPCDCSDMGEYQYPPPSFLPSFASSSSIIFDESPFAYFSTSTGL